MLFFSVAYNIPKFFEIETCIDTPPDNLNNSEHTFGLKATTLRSNPNYYITYTIWANFILMGFLPFMILIVVNGLTFNSLIAQRPNIKRFSAIPKSIPSTSTSCHNTSLNPFLETIQIKNISYDNNKLSKRHTRKETYFTKVSLMIVLVFIICHGVRWVPNIYEFLYIYQGDLDNDSFWLPWIDSVSNISHFLITLNSSVNFYIYYASQLKRFRKWIFCKIRG